MNDDFSYSTNQWLESYVRCPFYKRTDSSRRLTCEGPIPDTNITSVFRSGDHCKNQLKIFCCGKYEKCELYRAIFASREW